MGGGKSLQRTQTTGITMKPDGHHSAAVIFPPMPRPLLPSLQRALSPTLPQHLAHLRSAGVFKVILLLVPCLPYLETLSDCVKDTIRATVG